MYVPFHTAENDITIIIKRLVGSKRWQHMQRAAEDGQHQALLQVDPNYTVILGSHGNRCLKIERNGNLCCMVCGVMLVTMVRWFFSSPSPSSPQVHDGIGARVTSGVFNSYWLDYDNGAITIGAGTPSAPLGMHRWVDPQPLQDLCFVGLSSWDKHVAYRNIKVGPCLAQVQQCMAPPPVHDTCPTLASIAIDCLVAHLAPDNVVPLLLLADLPLYDAERLRSAAIAYLAAHVEHVLQHVPHHLCKLSMVHMEQLLSHAALVCIGCFCVYSNVPPKLSSSIHIPSPHTDMRRVCCISMCIGMDWFCVGTTTPKHMSTSTSVCNIPDATTTTVIREL